MGNSMWEIGLMEKWMDLVNYTGIKNKYDIKVNLKMENFKVEGLSTILVIKL